MGPYTKLGFEFRQFSFTHRERVIRIPCPTTLSDMHRLPGMLGLLQFSPPDMPVTQEPLLSSSCLQQGYHNAPHGAHRTGAFQRIRLSSSTRLLRGGKLVDDTIHSRAHQSKHSTTCCVVSPAMPENKAPFLLPSSAFPGLLVDPPFVWVSPGGPSPCLSHYRKAFGYYAASVRSPARWHFRGSGEQRRYERSLIS